MDLRTDNQKMRVKREKKICEWYSRLKAEDAGSTNQIIQHIVSECAAKLNSPITSMGVKYILIKNNLYESTSR